MLHIAVLCKTSGKTKKTTEECLASIGASALGAAPFDAVQTTIVESGQLADYNCTRTVLYDRPDFNYNHACNLALERIRGVWNDGDWACFMNNDIICSKDWIQQLSNAQRILPSIQSMCPNIGLVDSSEFNYALLLGCMLKKTFNGCCFMMRKDVLEQLGEFDEQFRFYFQDDDLVEWICSNNIQHGLAVKSAVTHIGQATTGKEDAQLLFAGALQFIKKHSMEKYMQIEAGKLKKLDFSALQRSIDQHK